MDKLEFALSLIRAPWIKRVTDRTFLQCVSGAVTAVVGVVAIWRTPGVPVDQKVNVTIAAISAVGVVIAAWNHGNQTKDTEIAKAVLSGSNPDTINAGTVLTGAVGGPVLGEIGQTEVVGHRFLDAGSESEDEATPSE